MDFATKKRRYNKYSIKKQTQSVPKNVDM